MTRSTQPDEFHVPKGSTIFRQGDPGEEMFLVADGHVRLTIGVGEHSKEIAVLGPGEFFGELSLLGNAPRTATAEAADDAVLLAINRSVFGLMMQDDLEIVYRMMNIQGERLRRADVPITDFLRRLGRIRIASQALSRVAAEGGAFPVRVGLDRLARELDAGLDGVCAVAEAYARGGAGRVADYEWQFTGWGDVEKLATALRADSEP